MSDAKRIAEQLVEDGLQAYSEGRLDDAMAKWLESLSRFPQESRAQQYLRYVEENRVALEQSFAYVRATTGPEWPAVAATGNTAAAGGGAAPLDAASLDAAPLDAAPLDAASGVAEAEARPQPGAAPRPRPPGGRSKTPSAELLSALNWDTVRAAAESREVTRTRQPTPASLVAVEDPGVEDQGVEVAPSPVAAFRPRSLGNEDLTPRMELVDDDPMFGAGEDVAWSGRPGDSEVATRPVARVEARTDFDAPDQNTGSLSFSTIPVAGVAGAASSEGALSSENVRSAVDDDAPRGGARLATPEAGAPTEALDVWVRSDDPGRHGEFDDQSQATTNVRLSASSERIDEGGASAEDVGGGMAAAGASEDVYEDFGGPIAADVSMAEQGGTAQAEGADSVVQLFDGLSDHETRSRAEELLAAARQLVSQGDCDAALCLSERLIRADATHVAGLELRAECQAELLRGYQARLTDLDEVPAVQMPQEQIMWHKLDHRAGFLLSRVDGVLSYGDILDISGMSAYEAYRILVQLKDAGVIGSAR